MEKRGSPNDMKLELAVVVDKHERATMLEHFDGNMDKAINIMLAIANGVQVSQQKRSVLKNIICSGNNIVHTVIYSCEH